MDSRWTVGLKGKEKEDFKSFIKSSLPVLEKLEEIIDKMQGASKPSAQADYNNPSWAYRQADHNGYDRGLQKVKALIKGIKE